MVSGAYNVLTVDIRSLRVWLLRAAAVTACTIIINNNMYIIGRSRGRSKE